MSPGFIHGDDLSKEVITLPFVSVQWGLRDCIVLPWKLHRLSNMLQVCSNPESCVEFAAQFCDILRFLLLTHVLSIGDQNPIEKQGVELCCSPRGAYLPSRNALLHRATVQHGNSASPHASHNPWKHSCVLQLCATSILIQKCCSRLVNMVLGRLLCTLQ